MAESHWDLCDFKNISPAFEATLSYFSIMPFLWNFHDFRVFVFGYRAPNENPEITENFYFWIYKVQTEVDKSRGVRISWKTNIWHIISKVVELFWERCHLNNISRVLEITFSYFSILGGLCRISVISEFSFLGIGLKTKTRKSRKIFMFRSAKFKYSGPVFRSLF